MRKALAVVVIGLFGLVALGRVLGLDPPTEAESRDRARLAAKARDMLPGIEQSGVRVACDRQEADVPARLWMALSTDEKRGLATTIALACSEASGGVSVTLRDAATARVLVRIRAGVLSFPD